MGNGCTVSCRVARRMFLAEITSGKSFWLSPALTMASERPFGPFRNKSNQRALDLSDDERVAQGTLWSSSLR